MQLSFKSTESSRVQVASRQCEGSDARGPARGGKRCFENNPEIQETDSEKRVGSVPIWTSRGIQTNGKDV